MNIPPALQRRRNYTGPALFAYGFRPFFLLAGLWAAFGILLWMPQYLGLLTLPTRFGALDWHIHEMLFGYVAAAVAGFLLTAIPNWTGRLPVNGAPLAALALLWLAGRVAILCTDWIGTVLAATIDVSFLAVLAAVAAREIVAGKNWRNLRVLVLLVLLISGNVYFHAEVLLTGSADHAVRFSISVILLMISLIGGRIVPSFTGNWLTRSNPGRKPVPFGRFDTITMAVSAAALAAWTVSASYPVSGAGLLLAGTLQAARLARWAGDRTGGEPLVLVLHVAYLFVPLGFLLTGASAFLPSLPASAGMHAWTAGAIGLMTLAVMSRATLGHTGQALHASAATQIIYLSVLLSALIRVVAAVTGWMALLEMSGALWIAGFALFVLTYAPLLVRHKPRQAEARC